MSELSWVIIGVVVAVVLGVPTIWLAWKSRKEAIASRAEDETKRALVERSARIEKITDSYIANNIRDAGMSGAIAAGVMSLQDSTEIYDFIKKVDVRLPKIPVIPAIYLQRIPPDRLFEFFQRLSLIENWGWRSDLIEKLIDDLRAEPRPKDSPP